MAVHILTNPQSTYTDPALPVDDPIVIAEQKVRHDERHNQDAVGVKLDPPRAETEWSIPPVSSASPTAIDDQSISLEIGVVYEIRPGSMTLFQNISENDKKIAFILSEYFLKNIDDTARKNIQKILHNEHMFIIFV